MSTLPLYSGFALFSVVRYKDGTYGAILRSETDHSNFLCHTGQFRYLRRTLKQRYGVSFTGWMRTFPAGEGGTKLNECRVLLMEDGRWHVISESFDKANRFRINLFETENEACVFAENIGGF